MKSTRTSLPTSFRCKVTRSGASHSSQILPNNVDGAEGRLGRLLIALSTGKGNNSEAAQVALISSHSELAQMAAMNRSHVTLTLGECRTKGLVEYERGTALLVNVQKLMVYLQMK